MSLEPIWDWIGRDLIPVEAKALSHDINRALLDDDRVKAEQLTRALHDRALQRIGEAMTAVAGDDATRRRLPVQVGTLRVLDDVVALAGILGCRDLLSDLARRLPNHMPALEREQIDSIKSILDAEAAQKTPTAAPTDKSDVFLCGLILIMGRLVSPWQLIRISVRAASAAAARIAETPYGFAVTIVIGEVECTVSELHTELKARRPVTSLLKYIHDAARRLRTEIDLSGDSLWSRQLTAIRTEVSNVLKTEIESPSGRVRRLLRPRAAKEIPAGSSLDAMDVSEAEMLVEFVGACRTYANELAVNEATVRSYSDLQHYLESGTKILLDSLRRTAKPIARSGSRRWKRPFCRIVFGRLCWPPRQGSRNRGSGRYGGTQAGPGIV